MLVAIPAEMNLGSISLSTSHAFEFRIQNKGTEPITPSVKVSCTGCTQAHLLKTTIGAGETTILKVIFTPKAHGQQSKVVRLNYTPKGLNQQSLAVTFNCVVI